MTDGTVSSRRVYLALGHATVDLDVDGAPALGGAVTFAAATAAALGWEARVVTVGGRVCATGPVLPDPLAGRVAWRCLPSDASTTFRNVYDADGARRQELLGLARPLAADDVPEAWRVADVVHLAPVAGEVGPDVAAGVRGGLLGVTPQGWLRGLEVGAPVGPGGAGIPEAVLACADAVVVSDEDAVEGHLALSTWADRVATVVVTHGARGATLLRGGVALDMAALEVRAVDPTGAGDVFAAALFVRMAEGATAADALRFAAVAAACSVERHGLDGVADRAAVLRRLAHAPTVTVRSRGPGSA